MRYRSFSRQAKKKRFQRRKVCRFCVNNQTQIDYKDLRSLRSLVTERGKIIPRRISGNCARHQRQLTTAIKQARNIALMPFAAGGRAGTEVRYGRSGTR